MQVRGTQIPSKGDQVEQRRAGVSRRGYVWYADHLQVLVKWEDGKSSSLRLDRDRFDILTTPGGVEARNAAAPSAPLVGSARGGRN